MLFVIKNVLHLAWESCTCIPVTIASVFIKQQWKRTLRRNGIRLCFTDNWRLLHSDQNLLCDSWELWQVLWRSLALDVVNETKHVGNAAFQEKTIKLVVAQKQKSPFYSTKIFYWFSRCFKSLGTIKRSQDTVEEHYKIGTPSKTGLTSILWKISRSNYKEKLRCKWKVEKSLSGHWIIFTTSRRSRVLWKGDLLPPKRSEDRRRNGGMCNVFRQFFSIVVLWLNNAAISFFWLHFFIAIILFPR